MPAGQGASQANGSASVHRGPLPLSRTSHLSASLIYLLIYKHSSFDFCKYSIQTYIYIYIYIHTYSCTSMYRYGCMYVCMSVCLSACLSVCLSVFPCIAINGGVYTTSDDFRPVVKTSLRYMRLANTRNPGQSKSFSPSALTLLDPAHLAENCVVPAAWQLRTVHTEDPLVGAGGNEVVDLLRSRRRFCPRRYGSAKTTP